MTKDVSVDIDAVLVKQLIQEQFPKWTCLPIKPVELEVGCFGRRFARLLLELIVIG